MNKEDIDKILDDYLSDYHKKVIKEEIERLNNIINELEWKPIEDYDKDNYDWVLVKYFDEDYECIPIVAEKRADGYWYSNSNSDDKIPFEVKYFFDMQLLDKIKELKEKDNV